MMLNPIIRREIKTSLRSWKMFLAIALYTLVVSGAAIIFINAITSGVYSTMNLRELSILYAVLGFMQFGMTMILIPALTAGSISGERERQTLDILLVTKMDQQHPQLLKLLLQLLLISFQLQLVLH